MGNLSIAEENKTRQEGHEERMRAERRGIHKIPVEEWQTHSILRETGMLSISHTTSLPEP